MASSSSAGSVNSTVWPTLYCNCGRSCAVRVVWKSEANRGRHYYRCANALRPCRTFIGWCDEFARATGFEVPDPAPPSSTAPVFPNTPTAEVSAIIAELRSMQRNVTILNIAVVAVVAVVLLLVLKP